VIRISGLSHGILKIPALAIPPGMTAVIGPNGSGKTTLLRLLAGIIPPAAGTITIDGEMAGDAVTGWVNESPDRNLIFGSVRDEIASPLRFRHVPCPETKNRVDEAASEAGITHLLCRSCDALSGGEKVLVAIATALAARPAVLVIDEWDSHLAGEAMEHAAGLIRNSGSRYRVFCTQNMNIAARADHAVFIRDGIAEISGPPASVFNTLKSGCFYPISWRIRDAA
jgi:energy-coupling factor transporter ATP-binding protein EcfA2